MGSGRAALDRLAKVARHLVDQVGLGLLAGLPAGVASFVFLKLLDAAIEFRVEQAPWLLWLLPAAAFVIVAVYHHFGGRAALGTTLVIVGRDYLSLSLPLAASALAGAQVASLAWLAKLVFTSVSVGAVFPAER